MAAFIGPALLRRLVADKAGLPLAEVERVLTAHEEVTLALLEQGAQVRMLGTGYFTVITTKRTRRLSPTTQKLVTVAAKRKIVFRESRKK